MGTATNVIPRYALWEHPISGTRERVRVLAYVHPGYFDVLDAREERRRIAREWLTFLADKPKEATA